MAKDWRLHEYTSMGEDYISADYAKYSPTEKAARVLLTRHYFAVGLDRLADLLRGNVIGRATRAARSTVFEETPAADLRPYRGRKYPTREAYHAAKLARLRDAYRKRKREAEEAKRAKASEEAPAVLEPQQYRGKRRYYATREAARIAKLAYLRQYNKRKREAEKARLAKVATEPTLGTTPTWNPCFSRAYVADESYQPDATGK